MLDLGQAECQDTIGIVGLGTLGIDAANADRMQTAAATLAMVGRLSDGEPADVVDVLATAQVATSESAMGECLSKAAKLVERLDATDWEIFEATARLTDERKGTADEIRTILCQGLPSADRAWLGANSEKRAVITQKYYGTIDVRVLRASRG